MNKAQELLSLMDEAKKDVQIGEGTLSQDVGKIKAGAKVNYVFSRLKGKIVLKVQEPKGDWQSVEGVKLEDYVKDMSPVDAKMSLEKDLKKDKK